MNRETIEHSWSIPDSILAEVDLLSGRERGRIYRIAPRGFTPPPPPRLGQATPAELVRALENPNAWWRETAQRLLFERQDRSAAPALRRMLKFNASELARLHALWTLSGLDDLREEDLLAGLGDAVPGVRENVVSAFVAAGRPAGLRDAFWTGLGAGSKQADKSRGDRFRGAHSLASREAAAAIQAARETPAKLRGWDPGPAFGAGDTSARGLFHRQGIAACIADCEGSTGTPARRICVCRPI